MAGRDRDEKQKQREPERELSKHHVSDGLHLRVCAIIIPPLQILLDNSSRDGIFFLSSMLYLLLDVLFLYVPLINEEAKCLTLDKRVKIAALVFLSVGDSRYLIRIYVRIKDGWVKSPPLRKLLGLAVCVLPIPQVAILLILPNTRGSNSLKTLTVLNGLVASQYFPRAYPLYQMWKAINFVNVGNMRSMKRHSLSFVHIRAKWMLNIFGYLVASHVDGLQDKGDEVYRCICECLEPMIYEKGRYIIRRGEPLDMMFFVTRGTVLTFSSNNGGSNGSSGTVQFEKEKDDLYGKELITWAKGPSSELSNLPISAITVKCYKKVEVFALHATDLKFIVSKFPSQFNMDRTLITIAVDNGTVN